MIYIPLRRAATVGIPGTVDDALLDIEGVARRLGITPSAVNQRMYGGSLKLPAPLTPEEAAALVFTGDTIVQATHREWLVILLKRAGGRSPMRLWLQSAVIEADES